MKSVNSFEKPEYQTQSDEKTEAFYNISGVEKADSNEYEEAIKEFTKAIGLNPMDAKSYFNRATLRVRIGDIEGARSDFRMAEYCRRASVIERRDYPQL